MKEGRKERERIETEEGRKGKERLEDRKNENCGEI